MYKDKSIDKDLSILTILWKDINLSSFFLTSVTLVMEKLTSIKIIICK